MCEQINWLEKYVRASCEAEWMLDVEYDKITIKPGQA